MARPLRREYSGAIYHVMNRGDRREDIFLDSKDREIFLRTLGEVCLKSCWQVHAYCLMGNHFHMVVETPSPTLVAGMKWFLGTYTQRFNRRHRLKGHLFAGRYRALLVDGSDNFYLRVVCDYVHLNPARARLLAEGEKLSAYPWSSYGEYLKKPKARLPWLRVDRLMGELGIRRDNARGRREFEAYMEGRFHGGEEDFIEEIRRGWKFGAADFADRIARSGAEILGRRENYQAAVFDQIMEVKGRDIISDELARRKLDLESLRSLRKGDREKLLIASRLRRETTLTLRWIAAELCAGTSSSLAVNLHHFNKLRD